MVKEVKMYQNQGFSIEEMKTHVEKGGDLASLPRRQSTPIPGHRDSIPGFSVPTFHQFILSFIVADDQVSRVYLRILRILFP